MSSGVVRLDCRVVAEGPAEVRLAVAGEVDLAAAPWLREFLRAELQRLPAGGVAVLDLGGVEFFSAAGVTELLAARELADRRRAALVVHPLSGVVELVLTACGVRDDLHVVDLPRPV
jgi:anti-anti-sigma factor